tara:strand:+ start:302 stop:811 length:510 start_codon:yes stop_codon:yes gene_type:complete
MSANIPSTIDIVRTGDASDVPEDTERPKKRTRKTKCTDGVFEQILEKIGLSTETWTDLDKLDVDGCAFVLSNKYLIGSLPLRVIGNLTFLSSDNPLYRRKAICAFARRLARELSTKKNNQQIQTYPRLIAASFRRGFAYSIGTFWTSERVPLAETFTGIFGWTRMLLFC